MKNDVRKPAPHARTRPAAVHAFLFACFVCITLGAACAAAEEPLPAPLRRAIERIDELTTAEYAKDKIGGVTVGVVAGDKLVWTKSYGWADMENRTPASRETVYRIGSITKWFTGLMVLQLVQDGKVALSDPVAKYFPEVDTVQHRPAYAPPITIEQLATMRSGLAREPADIARYSRGPVREWETVLIAALRETAYAYAPGSRYQYSNVGYATLGATLGRAAGMPYVEFIQQRALTPLQMNYTAFEPNSALLPHIAKGYQVTPTGAVSSEASQRGHQGRGYRVPNGGLYSTVGDLARFVSFQLGEGPETVLTKQALDASFQDLSAASGGQSRYGIGVQLTRRGGLVSFGHDGDVPGYLAHARIDRASKVGVIVLRNVNGGSFSVSGLTHQALAELANR